MCKIYWRISCILVHVCFVSKLIISSLFFTTLYIAMFNSDYSCKRSTLSHCTDPSSCTHKGLIINSALSLALLLTHVYFHPRPHKYICMFLLVVLWKFTQTVCSTSEAKTKVWVLFVRLWWCEDVLKEGFLRFPSVVDALWGFWRFLAFEWGMACPGVMLCIFVCFRQLTFIGRYCAAAVTFNTLLSHYSYI